MSDTMQITISMIGYILVTIGIGLYYVKRSNQSSDQFFLGGRSLGPWITAFSAEASDMSGWLLMGLPGVAYWLGLADAFWTALGLALGTYINWLLVAKRLRNYSIIANNSITLPEFFSNRFKEKKKLLLSIASVFILVFFTVYAASCFVTCGKLFATLFGADYRLMMVLGALLVLLYTYMGGFLAESTTDFVQGIVMIFALCTVVFIGVYAAGGFLGVFENIKEFPGFLKFFSMASPSVTNDVQNVVGGQPQFGQAVSYGFLTIVSTMAWGLGYFGMPQVLLRFMAIRSSHELTKSRRIAVSWVLISLAAAVFIGLIGKSLYPTELLSSAQAENIFIILSKNLLPPLIAGIVMSGILAATMSSADSYLLIAASALSKDIYKGIAKKDASDKQIMTMSRATLLIITVIGVIIALDENSVIFNIVSFAWAGFGATFGPVVLFSLFWKRTNRTGAVAGMISGGLSVFIWNMLIKPIGGIWGIYELLPAFIISCLFIVVVSLKTKEPSEEIVEDFNKAASA